MSKLSIEVKKILNESKRKFTLYYTQENREFPEYEEINKLKSSDDLEYLKLQMFEKFIEYFKDYLDEIYFEGYNNDDIIEYLNSHNIYENIEWIRNNFGPIKGKDDPFEEDPWVEINEDNTSCNFHLWQGLTHMWYIE